LFGPPKKQNIDWGSKKISSGSRRKTITSPMYKTYRRLWTPATLASFFTSSIPL